VQEKVRDDDGADNDPVQHHDSDVDNHADHHIDYPDYYYDDAYNDNNPNHDDNDDASASAFDERPLVCAEQPLQSADPDGRAKRLQLERND
jgi:hypothetical protein